MAGKEWLVLGWLAHALVREVVVWGLVREDGTAAGTAGGVLIILNTGPAVG